MRAFRLSLSLAAVAFSLSVGAQPVQMVTQLERIERPELAPRTIEEAVARSRQVRAQVIAIDLHDSEFIIPIAGNAAGGNGTYFRSDVVIANYRGAAQRIGVAWLQSGQNNVGAPLVYFNLPANTIVAQDDFVGAALGKSGLGAVAVYGVTAAGLNDDDASLDGFSRIWTLQPGSAGSVSQTFDAISTTDSIGSVTAYVVGLKQSGDFRSNVGIVNLDTAAHNWTVRSIATGASSTINVPAMSVVQTAIANGSGSGSSGQTALTLNSDGFGFWWTAYGSSTDNRTGDGWVARAKQ
jgi:hypothetical protein